MALYESRYLRTVHPRDPVGAWIRHTLHETPEGDVISAQWVTTFSPDGVQAQKASIRTRATTDFDKFEGHAGDAAWSVRVEGLTSSFHHLPAAWMYRSPFPKTKPMSVYPLALMHGSCSIGGREMSIVGWPGMVGHNWGSEHAHRWVWIHVAEFDGAPGSWLDITLARVKVGPFVTAWLPNGAICLDGRRYRVGGLFRRARVREHVESASIRLCGADVELILDVSTPCKAAIVLWEYGDPGGRKHFVANCSIASVRLTVVRGGTRTDLVTQHRGAYELGMQQPPAGYEVQPFPDPQI